MSDAFDNHDYVIEQGLDENGNISVRMSYEVVVLTQEEANRAIDKFQQLQSENAKLRDFIKDLQVAPCCGDYCWMNLPDRMRELGIEVNK